MNFLKHFDIYAASGTAAGVHFGLSGFVTHLENVVWAIISGLVVFTALHFFKKWSKWKD
jgi:hypothetical protein